MKTFVTMACALFGLAGPALSADLLTRNATLLPALANPPYSWFGPYVGAHGGYSWSAAETRLVGLVPGGLFAQDIAFGTLADRLSLSREGGLAGGQIGYNLQIGRYVVGVEADASWTDGKGTTVHSGIDHLMFAGVPTHTTLSSELEGFGTLRARAGLALDRTLVFITGGLAFGSVSNSLKVEIEGIYDHSWSRRDTELGWVVGAGTEQALATNITAKIEYLHYDLGDRTIRYADRPSFGPEHLDYRTDHTGDIARAGLNLRF